MEDGVTEAESLWYPKEEDNHKEGDDGRGGNHQEVGGEDRPRGSLLNNFFSNLVCEGETDEVREEGEGEKNEEKVGGFLENFISILVSPLNQKEEETNEDREGEVGEKEKAKEGVELVIVDEVKEQVKTEEEKGGGGGGIIDQIVSHFPTALPDGAAPTTDEASILIHSIVHD